MSWVAIGVGVSAIGTGYSIYSSNKQSNAAEDAQARQQSMLDGADGRAIFGSVPEAALFETKPYVPINYGQVQATTINDNIARATRSRHDIGVTPAFALTAACGSKRLPRAFRRT